MPRNRAAEASKHAKPFAGWMTGENDQRHWPAWLENHPMALPRKRLELSAPWQHYWELETDCLNLAAKEILYRFFAFCLCHPD